MNQEFETILGLSEKITVDDIYQLPEDEYEQIYKAIEQLETIFVVGKYHNTSYWHPRPKF